MDKKDLSALLARREGIDLDFKAIGYEAGKGAELAKDLMSMANLLAKDHCLNPFLTQRRGGAEKTEIHSVFLRVSASPRHVFHLPNALISTSTPAGRSSFISASTVC